MATWYDSAIFYHIYPLGLCGCEKENDYILKEGMVITIEPGIYLPGKFGIRTENMGVITADSFMNFTKSSREFTVL